MSGQPINMDWDEVKRISEALYEDRKFIKALRNLRVRTTVANIIERDFSPIRELRTLKNDMLRLQPFNMDHTQWLSFVSDFKTPHPPTAYYVWGAVTTIQKYWRLRGRHVRPRRAAEIDRVLGEVCDMPRDVTRLIGSY
jgi:hypothetical protein